MNIVTIALALLISLSFASAYGDCKPKGKKLVYPDGSQLQMLIYTHDIFTDDQPTILVVPPTGGTNVIDRNLARYYCNNSFRAVILDHWTGDDPDFNVSNLKAHYQELQDGENAVRRAVHYFSQSNIGISTSSRGAIAISAIAHKLEANVKAVFLAVPGSPLHLNVTQAGEESLKELREKRLEYFGISQKQYDREMKKVMSPFKTQNKPSRLKAAILVSEKDEIVPSKLQLNFVNKWKPQKAWRTLESHGQTIAMSYFVLRDEILQFFKKHVKKK